MFLSNVFDVLVILCALSLSSRASETNDTQNATCDVLKPILGDTTLVLNCSQRHINQITNWPEEINGIDKDSIDRIRVTFYNNSITNVTHLPPLPGKLISISFSNNRIIEIEKNAFSDVDRVISLMFSYNNITGQVLRSEIFQGPFKDNKYGDISLQILYLDHNDIHSLDRYLFKHTPNLTQLFLNNNPIEILDPVTVLAISSATNLQTLDLSYTDINSIPLDAFKGLVNLRFVELSGNRFVTVPESLRVIGDSLEVLMFNNNYIVELNDDSFVGLTNLRELEVGDNVFLEEVKRSTFSPLLNLKILHLCHNRKLRYISHNAFRGLKDKWTLSEVYLDDNNLSELSTDLMPWSKLDILGMSENNWLCNCDLANIVTAQGAGKKFKPTRIPMCAAPMRLSGEYITNITLAYCPTFDTTFTTKKGFSLSDLKPKHILWSIFGVGLVVCAGMLLGLLVNYIKGFYNKKIRSQPIRYINLNEGTSFA